MTARGAMKGRGWDSWRIGWSLGNCNAIFVFFFKKKKKNLSVIETCSVDIDFCSLFYSWTERSQCHRMIFYCRYRVPCTSLNLSFCGFL